MTDSSTNTNTAITSSSSSSISFIMTQPKRSLEPSPSSSASTTTSETISPTSVCAVKTLQGGGGIIRAARMIPSRDSLVRMRCYTMPSSMKLPYCDTKTKNTMTNPDSLESLMAARRASLLRMQRLFAAQLHSSSTPPQQKPHVNFAAFTASPTASTTTDQEPPTKKRRFQRRNSKTPAMLLSSLNDIMGGRWEGMTNIDDNTDVSSSNKEHHDFSFSSSCGRSRDEILEGGVQIAEELVRTMQLRRSRQQQQQRNQEPSSTPRV